MEKKSYKERIKEFADTLVSNKISAYDENPVENVLHKFFFVQFIFNALLTLGLLAISTFSLIFKITENGWTTSIYILLVANALYLLMIFIYYLIYKSRKDISINSIKFSITLLYIKWFMKALKLSVSIILIATPTGKIFFDIFTIITASISGFFTFIAFIKATFKLIKYNKNKDKYLEKNEKRVNLLDKVDNYYEQARIKRNVSQNKENIIELDDTSDKQDK